MITRQQKNHVLRLITQKIVKPKVAIIGGYHGVNLGDIALGESVRLVLKDASVKSGLQTIYNLNKWPWPITKYTIIGGGAVGYQSSLDILQEHLSGDYSNLAFMGVDFNENSYKEETIKMLKSAKWISCRNEFQAQKLTHLTQRKDITFHPDLVFSYQKKQCEVYRQKPKKKKLLVNVVPLYGHLKDGKMVPADNYKEERPELYQNYDVMISSYKEGVRSVVKKALDEGYEVESIPFTPADDQIAKFFLKDLPVNFTPFDENPDRMIAKIAEAEKVFATRYHATILSIKQIYRGLPGIYAVKNEKLLNELGYSDFISSSDLAKGNYAFNYEVLIDSNVIKKWEDKAYNAIKNCLEVFNLKK